MNISRLKNRFAIFLLSVGYFIAIGCNHSDKPAKKYSDLTKTGTALMDSIQKRISREGPVAWLDFFEDSPGFYMVSNGKVEFSTYDSARKTITNTLVKIIGKIQLNWTNVRIDSLSPGICFAGADFYENLLFLDGRKIVVRGYFTAVARNTLSGMKIYNAHWSILPA